MSDGFAGRFGIDAGVPDMRGATKMEGDSFTNNGGSIGRAHEIAFNLDRGMTLGPFRKQSDAAV